MPAAAAHSRTSGLQALVKATKVVGIDSVRPLVRNPRIGDVDLIRESLRYHGQYVPIVVRKETGEVLKGNHTWYAAKAEGHTEIAIVLRSEPSDAEAQKLAIADNHTSDVASWDLHGLAELLDWLPDLEGTTYDPGDVDRLLADFAERLEDPPAPPAPPEPEWVTRPGDRIQLGRHLLICGDARDDDAWAQLHHNPAPAGLLWTDPPYGVDLSKIAGVRGRDHGEMEGDVDDDAALLELLTPVLARAYDASREDASFYVCHADTKRAPVAGALEATGWSLRQVLVWAKDSLVIGRQDYQWMHEPIAYGWKHGASHRWYGDRDKTTLIENPTRQALEALEHADLVELLTRMLEDTPGTLLRFARPRVADEHPTSKPVEIIAAHLHNSCQPGEIVLDPFAGAGSTLLAAEQTDRTAHMIEIHPGYCDVTVTRWEELTGATAMRPSRRRRKAKA